MRTLHSCQVVGDILMVRYSFQNGKLSTQLFDVIVNKTNQKTDSEYQIKCIRKTDMAKLIEYKVTIKQKSGPKKPCVKVLPLHKPWPEIAQVKLTLPV